MITKFPFKMDTGYGEFILTKSHLVQLLPSRFTEKEIKWRQVSRKQIAEAFQNNRVRVDIKYFGDRRIQHNVFSIGVYGDFLKIGCKDFIGRYFTFIKNWALCGKKA